MPLQRMPSPLHLLRRNPDLPRPTEVDTIPAMIAFLRGTVAEALPNSIVIDVNGVGYEVIVPLSTYDALNPLRGQLITLKTHFHIRENAQVLYGFATDEERDIFRLLVERVSGIGPATAVAILSGLRVADFKQAVVQGDVQTIARAKGVGKKTAERIVLELKDKVGLASTWEAQQQGSTSQAAADAELALVALGFKQTEARKALAPLVEKNPQAPADELIRGALRSMGS